MTVVLTVTRGWDPLFTRWYGLDGDLYNPFVDHTLRLIQHNWVVLAYNLNVVNFGANNWRVKYSANFLLFSNHKCTQPCYFPTISVLNLTIFPCYSNLLLRMRRWAGILRRGVLGYVLPRLPFLWSYEVIRCSVSLRVIIVFRDITYVIIVLYS
jgi:hypothetical protein